MAEKETTVWGIHAGKTGAADDLFLKKNYAGNSDKWKKKAHQGEPKDCRGGLLSCALHKSTPLRHSTQSFNRLRFRETPSNYQPKLLCQSIAAKTILQSHALRSSITGTVAAAFASEIFEICVHPVYSMRMV